MTGRSAEASVCVLASEDEVNSFVTRQGLWKPEQMECSQAPVYAIQSQVFGQPIVELIFSLQNDQYTAMTSYSHGRTLSKAWMYLTCFSTTRLASSVVFSEVEIDPPTPGPATRDIWSDDTRWRAQREDFSI